MRALLGALLEAVDPPGFAPESLGEESPPTEAVLGEKIGPACSDSPDGWDGVEDVTIGEEARIDAVFAVALDEVSVEVDEGRAQVIESLVKAPPFPVRE